MTKKKPTAADQIIERLTTEARILGAAAVLVDGRTSHAKFLRRTSDLLAQAAIFITGMSKHGSPALKEK